MRISLRRTFIVYSFFALSISFLIQHWILTDHVLVKSYSEQLDISRIAAMISGQKKWFWIGYVLLPIVYLIKFMLISSCILIGSVIRAIHVQFGMVFKTVIIADGIFLAASLMKFFWFLGLNEDFTISNWQSFSLLSLHQLWPAESVELWLQYPLQTINIFEILYVFGLTFLLSKFSKIAFSKLLSLVFQSYLIGLCIWVVLVMFISFSLNGHA